MTREEIVDQLREIEKAHNVRVLLAVESGSRAWGFASPDSDWDVRFIYVNPVRQYLRVEPIRDVIEVMTDSGFDAVGWDLRKALQLFRRTNPSILEWLLSPIRYIDTDGLAETLLSLIPSYYNPKSGIHHYLNMAISHNEKYLLKNGITLKRFLYYLRSLLACRWIMDHLSPPPVPFHRLIEATVKEAPVLDAIHAMLAKKTVSKEHDKEEVDPLLLNYARTINDEVEAFLSSSPLPTPERGKDETLDNLLYSMAKLTPDDHQPPYSESR